MINLKGSYKFGVTLADEDHCLDITFKARCSLDPIVESGIETKQDVQWLMIH